MATFENRLKELRERRGLSQATVSAQTGITSRYYQYLEYGEREPGLTKLKSLADFFNVSIDYLVGRTDNPEVNK